MRIGIAGSEAFAALQDLLGPDAIARQELEAFTKKYAGARVRSKRTSGPIVVGDVGTIVRVEPAFVIRWPKRPREEEAPHDYFFAFEFARDLAMTSDEPRVFLAREDLAGDAKSLIGRLEREAQNGARLTDEDRNRLAELLLGPEGAKSFEEYRKARKTTGRVSA